MIISIDEIYFEKTVNSSQEMQNMKVCLVESVQNDFIFFTAYCGAFLEVKSFKIETEVFQEYFEKIGRL